MSFAPIVTTNSTPIVTVSPNITSSPTSVFSSNVTYDQILQSLGSFVYGSEFIFSSLTFNLEPNITVYFKTFTLVTSESLMLNALHDDNFQDVEKTEGVKFFEDYCNYLIDEEDATKA